MKRMHIVSFLACVAVACWVLFALDDESKGPLAAPSSVDGRGSSVASDTSPLPVATQRIEIERDTALFRGKVVWATGDPVKNCHISCNGADSTTDSNGFYDVSVHEDVAQSREAGSFLVTLCPPCWVTGTTVSVSRQHDAAGQHIETITLPDKVDVTFELSIAKLVEELAVSAGASHWDVSLADESPSGPGAARQQIKAALVGREDLTMRVGFRAMCSVALSLRFPRGRPSLFVTRQELALSRDDSNIAQIDVLESDIVAGRVVDQFGVGIAGAKLSMLREGDRNARETLIGVGDGGVFLAFPPSGQSVRLRARHAGVEVVMPGCSPGAVALSLMLDLRGQCVVRVVDGVVPVTRFALGGRPLCFGKPSVPALAVHPYGETTIECSALGTSRVLTWIESGASGDSMCREEIVALPPVGDGRAVTIDVATLPRTPMASLKIAYGGEECLVMLRYEGFEVGAPYQGRQVAAGSNTPGVLHGLPAGNYEVIVSKGAFESPAQWRKVVNLLEGNNEIDIGSIMQEEYRLP